MAWGAVGGHGELDLRTGQEELLPCMYNVTIIFSAMVTTGPIETKLGKV